jgi:hypothetical protein
MMPKRWDEISKLTAKGFRRLTGVKRQTFEEMVELLKTSRESKLARGGRKPKLCVEETLLMALEYLREYRTYFHISKSYGVSEGYACKLIRRVEDTLIKSTVFHLPGRKALLKSDTGYEVILIDASETPIQRPKKNSAGFIQVKRKGIP